MRITPIATDACVLVDDSSVHNGAASSVASGVLAHTGFDISTFVGIASALVAVGILLIILGVHRRRSRRGEKSVPRATGALLIALMLCVAVGNTALIAAPALAVDNSSQSSAPTGCALLEFTSTPVSADSNTLIDGIPRKVMVISLTNISSLPIDVTFSARALDANPISQFVEITSFCDLQPTPLLKTKLTDVTPGKAVHLASAQHISLQVYAAIVGSPNNPLQTTQTQFALVADAMETR
jgi:hypothetical protein